MNKRVLFVSLAAIAIAAGSNPAQAEERAPWVGDRGWSVGFHLLSNNLGANDADPNQPNSIFVEENGGGVALNLGYAFAPSFALHLVAAGARHETTRDGVEVNHGSVTLEAHYRFRGGERTQPYLLGGLGGASLELTSNAFDSKVSGATAVFGGGLLYHFSRHLSLDVAARVDLINWDRVEVTASNSQGETITLSDPVEEDGSAGKILVGLGWAF